MYILCIILNNKNLKFKKSIYDMTIDNKMWQYFHNIFFFIVVVNLNLIFYYFIFTYERFDNPTIMKILW